ncbi:helix-turn-helix transcriptional regulator [Sphingobacterium sp. BN32]|uniref:helix-turn-helix transcriptional regulator n=1 Tax=Sphingobacterium sp. BN32 TaxID=3058432 RepID=UPI00265D11B9|nr:AraC family transcriptional regulator [Sphingobacterium sp. BN32]WKK59551.1 AraC family transcriptional regulator [Sphingobacterium sp. BN32]
MHLYSRIPELDSVTYDLEIPDGFCQNAKIQHENIAFERFHVASIHLKQLYSSGFFLEECKLKTTQILSEEFSATGDHVRFFFYLNGKTSVQNGAGLQNYAHRIGMLLHNYLNEQGGGGKINIEPDNELNYIVLKMSREYYLKLTEGETWLRNDRFHQYVESGVPENRPNESFMLDLQMLKVIEEIFHGPERFPYNTYMYIAIKLKELLFLVHQSRNYAQINQIDAPFRETLLKIKSYLEANLERPPNAHELAFHFRYNEKNLKRDFKNLFGTSIYAYIVKCRMELARSLLGNNYNVNELSTRLGYRSVSHFIKVFKQHFGYTPNELMKRENWNSPH